MGISGVNDYSKLADHSSMPLKKVVIEENSLMTARESASEQPLISSEKAGKLLENIDISAKKIPEFEDLSITFNKQEDFDYLGKDKDISGLDMKKAISDMQKDRLLQQYQYFVGSSRTIGQEGIVIPKYDGV